MRSLFALALVLSAPSGGDRSNQSAAHNAASTRQARGLEAFVRRLPRGGGEARATAYSNLDPVGEPLIPVEVKER